MTSLYRQYHDVLGAENNALLLDAAFRLEPHFQHSRLAPGRIDRSTRASSVVYDDLLPDAAQLVREAVEVRLGKAVTELGIGEFESTGFEIQLTSHNNGEFFRRHTDSRSSLTASRVVAFVYYLYRQPKAFAGGEVVFFDADGREEVVDTPNDSMLIFDSRTPHEVRPVSCPTGSFNDGRFTVNGWVHRSRPTPRAGFAFDHRIFTSVGNWTPPASAPTMRARITARPPRASSQRSRADGATASVTESAARALLDLYGNLHRQRSTPDSIDVRADITAEQFFDEYYRSNRPVLIPGLLAGSEAVAMWSPDYFVRRFGAEMVEITDGREQHPDYEVQYRDTVRTVTMAEFVRRLTDHSESNNFYLVARNHFFDRHPFHQLRDQLRPPTDIVDTSGRHHGAMKMWFGPRGTVTPLHFDNHSILFVQVYGRKQFKLVPSFDYPRMYVRHRYYSEVDPTNVDPIRHPLFAGATVMDVEVRPGDALLLPAAWWHWARSLSVSISATFSEFVVDNIALAHGRPR